MPTLPLFVTALALMTAGGLASLMLGRRPIAAWVGLASCLAACGAAATAAAAVLASGASADAVLPWPVPFGSLHLGLDGLSSFFALVIALVCAPAALFGASYLKPRQQRKNLGSAWFFFNLLAASMLTVVSARDAMLFLVSWEIMTLASFFLVMFDGERAETISAGWTYLVATHLGTAFLLAMFVLLGGRETAMDFSRLQADSPAVADVCFLLALVGFGTKAGLVPLHVWLPQAHPAAPSHVSAVMSGVMIKTGIYGLLRTLTLLGTPPLWWGWTLVGIGAASGVFGVLLALAQHDLKRLLAYHSVENIGIITIGIGLGLVGISEGDSALAALGMLGGLMHVLNHGLFKSLLFFGAGSIQHATGSRNIERMGGLVRRMGTTAATFMVGSAAISGLPPLNGFVSEFLIYVGAFGFLAERPGSGAAALPAAVAILALALIGGLAAACFAKAFGIAFLGEPRSAEARSAHEVPPGMRLPMAGLAIMCAGIGLLGALAVTAAAPAAAALLPGIDVAASCRRVQSWLWLVSSGAALLLATAAALALLRHRLLARRDVRHAATWDCGYAAPDARMQYTASSFASPILGSFRLFLRPALQLDPPAGLFPGQASLASHAEDMFERRVFAPLFRMTGRLAARLRWLQAGPNQVYVLYVALTMLVLLVWRLK